MGWSYLSCVGSFCSTAWSPDMPMLLGIGTEKPVSSITTGPAYHRSIDRLDCASISRLCPTSVQVGWRVDVWLISCEVKSSFVPTQQDKNIHAALHNQQSILHAPHVQELLVDERSSHLTGRGNRRCCIATDFSANSSNGIQRVR